MSAAEDLKNIWTNGVPNTISLIKRKPKMTSLLVIIFLLWTFCGWVYSDDFENEGYVDFFVKMKPTPFHGRFRDSYASDNGEEHAVALLRDKNGNWLPKTTQFEEYALYCWHRYGIANTAKSENLEACKKMARTHGIW